MQKEYYHLSGNIILHNFIQFAFPKYIDLVFENNSKIRTS